jgi:archaeosortase B (VPXXXP-CTERM-specific)
MAKSERKKKSKSRQGEHKGKSKSIAPIRKKDVGSILVEKVNENKEALRYIVLFLALSLLFYLVYYYLTLRGSLSILNTNTAFILGEIFSLGGANVIRNGQFLFIQGFGMEIIDECTAVFSSIVYCSAILAYPTTLKNKGLGMVFGIPLLYLINIFRLVILVLVGIHYPTMFEFVHVYLWQASFIIFVVVLFLLWLKLVVKD